MVRRRYVVLAILATCIVMVASYIGMERNVKTRDILKSFGISLYEPVEGRLAALLGVSVEEAEGVAQRAIEMSRTIDLGAAFEKPYFDTTEEAKLATFELALGRFLAINNISGSGSIDFARNENGRIDGIIYQYNGRSVDCLPKFIDFWESHQFLDLSEDPESYLKIIRQ